MCFKRPMTGNVGARLPLSLCKIPLLWFSGLVNAPCPHRFWHWCARMQKSQGTGSPVLHHLDGPKIPLNGPYFSLWDSSEWKSLTGHEGTPARRVCFFIEEAAPHLPWEKLRKIRSACSLPSAFGVFQQELTQPCADQASAGKQLHPDRGPDRETRISQPELSVWNWGFQFKLLACLSFALPGSWAPNLSGCSLDCKPRCLSFSSSSVVWEVCGPLRSGASSLP